MSGQEFDDVDGASEFDSESAAESEVAERLAPIANASVPDLWAGLEAGSPTPVVGLDVRATPTRWLVPALAAATVVALLAAATLLAPRQGQEIQSPGDQADEADDLSQDQPTTTQAEPAPSFPDDLEIGPDRTAMSSIPFGNFALHYEAGIVVVDPDGAVRGHYPQPDPEFLVEVERAETSDPVPEDCVLDGFAPADTTRLFCRGRSGPTVEVVDEQGQRHIIASFPQPPESLPEQATVFGTIVAAFPSPVPWRPAPLLLQMNAECESRLAVTTNGETIRHIDGTDYWDDTWPAGQSVALGWNPDGTEAYVWRTNGGCDENLEQPGVYAFAFDGNSRLLFPTDDRVSDVALITGRRFPTTGGDTDTLQQNEAWQQWAGELRYESTQSDEFNSDSSYGTDLELISRFVAEELRTRASDYAVTATEPAAWIVIDRDVSIKLVPNISISDGGPTDDDLERWDVERASTFWPDGEGELAASVSEEDGVWSAVFFTAAHGAEVSASYELGGQTLEAVVIDSGDGTRVLRFVLDGEPEEQATLTIRWHDGDRLVGFERAVIPPGEFAAS